MKLQRTKTIITGITAALLLSIGMFTTPAFADGYSNGHANNKGKNGYYVIHGNELHYRDNRSRRHTKHRNQNRGRGHARHRSLGLHHKDHQYKGQRRHNVNRHHFKRHRGRASHRNKDLLGAVAGGIILYNVGRELSKR